MMKFFRCLLAIWLLPLLTAAAADIYVSPAKGRDSNPGTAAAPLADLRQALKKAAAGDTIRLAEGNHAANGPLTMTAPVSLIGGYSADFTVWNPLKHLTIFQPRTGTPPGKNFGIGILKLDFRNRNYEHFSMLLQGLIFDDGAASAYSSTEGVVPNVAAGKWLRPQENGKGANRNAVCSAVGINQGDLTIKDCLFVNSSGAAVNLPWNRGCIIMVNNVFCNCRMLAAQVIGTGAGAKVFWDFSGNTVVFTWCRQEELTDMGHGVRVGSNVIAAIHDNLIGLNTGSGISAVGHQSGNRKVKIHDNTFFGNRKGDVRILSDGNQLLTLKAEELNKCSGTEDLEGADGNKSDAGVPPAKTLNTGYLTAFQQVLAANKESGLTGMYANRYPALEALKIFGAVPGKGAVSNAL